MPKILCALYALGLINWFLVKKSSLLDTNKVWRDELDESIFWQVEKWVGLDTVCRIVSNEGDAPFQEWWCTFTTCKVSITLFISFVLQKLSIYVVRCKMYKPLDAIIDLSSKNRREKRNNSIWVLMFNASKETSQGSAWLKQYQLKNNECWVVTQTVPNNLTWLGMTILLVSLIH